MKKKTQRKASSKVGGASLVPPVSKPSGGDTPTDQAVLDTVRSCIAQVLGVNADVVYSWNTLLELGAQSFDFMHLVFRLETTYRVELPRVLAIPEAHTVQTYADAISAKLVSKQRQVSVGD